MSSSRARAVRALGLALALRLVACGSDDAASETTGDADPEMEGPLRPTFSEPASGMLSLLTTREEDLVLAVEGVTAGLTDLVIDDRSFGPLPEGAAVGRLEAGSLRLHIRGSMLPGEHRMFMRTIDGTGQAESEQIIVAIEVESSHDLAVDPPTLSALSGTRLVVDGTGDDALVVVWQDAAEGPRLHLVPWGETGWDPSAARTVSAPGLVLRADERTLPATALRYTRDDDGAERVRVAWRVDAVGTRIDMIDAAWDTLGVDSSPTASLSVEDALAGRAAEWAQLGRPRLLADLLVAELWAPVDAESPRPGDRAVVWSQVVDDGLQGPQRVSVRPDLIDLDQVGPVIDRIGLLTGGPPALGLRADQHQPLVLEVDPAGGLRPRPTVIDGSERSFSFVDMPLATITGAFGSRTVAGLTASANGRMRVVLLDDVGDGGATEYSFSRDDLPPLDAVTGELAPGVVAGMSVFLVPYGQDQPVRAIYTAGDSVQVIALTALHCDSVALATMARDDGQVPLACAADGLVQLGTLYAVPEPAG